MKKYLFCLVALLIIAVFGLSLSMAMPLINDDNAETFENPEDIIADSDDVRIGSYDILTSQSISNVQEHDEMITNVTTLEDIINNQNIDIFEADSSATKHTTNGDFKVDFDRMYRIYGVNPDWMDAIESSEQISFADYILDSYIWEAPIYDKNNVLTSSAGFRKGISFSEYLEIKPTLSMTVEQEKDIEQFVKTNEGKWYWSRTGNMIPCDDLAFVTNIGNLSKYIDSFGFHVIEDIRYVSIDAYLVDFVYIRADGSEYGIPFVQRSEYLQNGIENRVLSPIDKILRATLVAVSNNKLQEPIN